MSTTGKRRIAAIVITACMSGCGGASPNASEPVSPASEQAQSQLSETGAAATLALDASRCEQNGTQLRPFVVGWDATEQSEFSAHGQRSLMVVKVSGCTIELLSSCQIPGEYRLRTTEGAMQSLQVSSEGELYATLPLAIAKLSGKLHRDSSLDLKYFVRGMKYATAPILYRSDLGAGCEGATHYVLNYAAGAYSLAERASRGAGAGVDVGGVGAGAKEEASSASLFQGGSLDACATGGVTCTAPVRLRLMPIADAPAEADDAVRKASLKRPEAGVEEHQLTPVEIRQVLRTGMGSIATCFGEHSGGGAVTLKTKFEIEPDGVVQRVTFTEVQGADRELAQCIAEVFFTLRFPVSSKPTAVVYPFRYSP